MISKTALILAALLWAVVVAGMPGAAGAQSAALDQAIAAWLHEDEMAGLSAMAELARAGDADAQLLLGVIDKDAALQGPAVLALSRPERIAVLRAPGGLSGTSWLRIAAEQGAPIAQAWVALLSVEAGPGLAARFAALGERRALRATLLAVAKRREHGFPAQLMAQKWYPPALYFLSHDRVLTPDRAAALDPGDPQRRFLTGAPATPDPDALEGWLMQSDTAQALRSACTTVCPQDAASCARALYNGLGSYTALLTHGSPAETLVPPSSFADSARGRAALARRIMLRKSSRMRDVHHGRLAETSACAADWLADKYDQHTIRPIPLP